MTASNLVAAAQATAWVTAHRGELSRAAARAGLPPRDLDGAAWLAALAAAIAARHNPDNELPVKKIIAAAVRRVLGKTLVSRPHRGPDAKRDFDVEVEVLAGGDEPLEVAIALESLEARRGSLADAVRKVGYRGREAVDRTVRRRREKTRCAREAGQFDLVFVGGVGDHAGAPA